MQTQNQRLQNKVKDMMGLSPRRFNTDLNPILEEIQQVTHQYSKLNEDYNRQSSLVKSLEQRCREVEETMMARINHLNSEHERAMQAKHSEINEQQLKIEEQR